MLHLVPHSGKSSPNQPKSFLLSRVAMGVFSLIGLLGWVLPAQSQLLYNQTFGTSFPLTGNTITTSGVYCDASPGVGQLTSLASSGSGTTYEVPAGTQRLTFVRTTDAGAFTRSVAFSPLPSSLVYRFDLTVSGNSVATPLAARIALGENFSNATIGEEPGANTHSRIGINFTSTPGLFTLENGDGSATSSSFSGTQTIYYVINNEGGARSYQGPDGTVQTVGSDKEDIWVGTSLVFDEADAVTGSASLSNLKFAFIDGAGTIELDNILVAHLTANPTAPGSQMICQAATPTVSQLAATGTNLQWYTSQNGGSPLLSSDPLATGTYWVSQTIGTIESARVPSNVVVSNVDISGNSVASNQTICSGQVPSGFTGSVPTILNGSGIFSYQWEVSASGSGSGFSNLSGETNQNYTPVSPLAGNRWYRRIVSSDGCQNVSAPIEVTVLGLLTNTLSASGPQTICQGTAAPSLSGVPTGGNGTYSYIWLSSVTSATAGFSVISGETSQNLAPGVLSQTTWFRRIVSSGPCGPDTSNAIEITVQPQISGNTLSSPQTVCISDVPAPVTGGTVSGGNGVYAYSWEFSTTSPGTTGFVVSGTTTPDLVFVLPLLTTTWYRRTVTSGACSSVSGTTSIAVSTALDNNTVASAQTICSGSVPLALTGSVPTGGLGAYQYQWESSTVSASSGFSPISGANSQGYAPGALTTTTWFRRVVTAGPCPASISSAVQVTVDQPISTNDAGSSQTICNGLAPATLVGSVPVGGNGIGFVYQWEVATALAGPYTSAGGTSQDFSPGVLTANRWYRRRVTSGVCPVSFSDTVAITVTPTLSNNTISTVSPQTVCSGSGLTINASLPTGGNGVFGYTWEVSTTSASAGFVAIPSSNSQNFSTGPITQNSWYRRVVISGGCTLTTGALSVVVNQPIANNTASASQSLCASTTPAAFTGSVPTGGNGTSYAYLWEISTSLPGTFTTTGITTQNYAPPAQTANRWFRRRVTSGVCPVTYSDTLVLQITPALASNSITTTSPQTICSGNSLNLNASLPTGGNGSFVYQWEVSTTSSSTGFSAVPSGNSQNLNTGPLTQNSWFRRRVTSGSCSLTTAALSVVINQPIANNDASASQSICANTAPAALVGSVPTGGTGTYAYLWEVATSLPGTFSSASATTQGFSPGTLTANRWYRRRVTSGVCPVTYSDTIAISVTPALATNTITTTSPQTICTGSSLTLNGSVATGGNGAYTYTWELSTTSGSTGFAPIPSSDVQNLPTGPLTVNSWFRRRVNSGSCSTTTSALSVVINQPIANNRATASQAICGGTAPTLFAGTLPTGGNGTTYTYSWEQATAFPGTFTAIGGASGQSYQAPTLTANRWFRRRVTSGACPATFSDTLAISVTPAIAGNTITNSQTICTGNSPAGFTGPVPTGGNLTYAYQWQISTTFPVASFSDIPGANGQTYSHGALTANTSFRRVVTSGVCTSNSGAVLVTITQPIQNNDAAAPQSICSGTAPAQLTGSVPTGGNGTSYSYQWEFSTTAGGTFSNLGGATAINYTSPTLTASRWFRRRVTSGACPATFSDTVAVLVTPAIANNTITAAQTICEGSSPATFTGTNPTGGNGAGTYAYFWEVSTTSASTGFSVVADSIQTTLAPGPLFANTWYRRAVTSGPCVNRSAAIAIQVTFPHTVNVGPAVPDMVQGGITGPLGGSFGGGATGAIWTATGGSFTNNTGSTPGTATYTASLISAPLVTLTLTTFGGACPPAIASKLVNVAPDPFGITGVINKYAEVIAPTNIPVGSLSCTVAAGEGANFAPRDRAMIIQMKGVAVSLPASPTDVSYGYITAMNNAGNNEMLNIDTVIGDVVYFQRCVKKAYNSWGRVQLVKIPKYTGDYNVKGSLAVSAVRLTRKGMGYPPNTILTSGFTVTPVQGGIGLQLQARTDALGQISEVEVLDGGSGYEKPPLITLPDPTEAPFNLPAYKAKALAVMGLTAKQWNGRVGGILAFEVNGDVTLNDSIHMTGMGFAGGMIGDKGAVSPTCGVANQYGLDFATYTRSGQKGEGIANIPTTALRGKGRYGTGGGGGMEPEGGGGGGANWEDGGRGGSSSYIVITNSICSTSVTPCDKDVLRGGLGGGTNPTIPVGTRNVLRANSYNFKPENVRFFLGGGGGGGHAFNDVFGAQSGGAGGYGGGIVIMKGDSLRSNNLEILAKGERGEAAIGDGAGGGGAGGAILLYFDGYKDAVLGRIRGGDGGNSIPTVCEFGFMNFPDRKRYAGAGGGGGGGVIWFSADDDEVTNFLSTSSDIGQSAAGFNEDGLGNTALKGGGSRHQCELEFIENRPYLGSNFIVGGTSPRPDFPNLSKAAEWLAFKGTDASEVNLLLTTNTANSTTLRWHVAPITFKQVFTPGCVLGDATVVVRPRTTVNSVNLQNEIDDLQYITLDGVPQVTFRDLLISGTFTNTNSGVVVRNGSKLVYNNVTAQTDVRSEASGNNEITMINSTNTGSLEAGTNQIINVVGTLNLNGATGYNPGLRLGSGSTFNLPAGTVLNLNGGSWYNNGAANLNIDPTSTINFGGSFSNQQIGGTVATTFDKINLVGTGQLTTITGPTVREWNQTGSMVVSTSTRTITITEKVRTGPGRFTSSGVGKVSLSGPAAVEVQGRFGNLEINSPNHATATAAIQVDQNLIMTNGKLDMNGLPITIENPSGSSATSTATSWVVGSLRRRVQSGQGYLFPIGTSAKQERAFVNMTSVTGMQYLTATFRPQDGNVHPVASVVTPLQDGPAYFSALLPDGYWSVEPDAGTATYDMWLYPSFYDLFPQYSIYKRATGGNEWSILGSLSNGENTPNYVQSDGSVRRTGLTGFSDFGIAGGEEPLPLHILDFRAFARRGNARLSWKMGECLKEGQFRIFRGTNPSRLELVGIVNVAGGECKSEFETQDPMPSESHVFHYQIEAHAPNEKPVRSAIRTVNIAENQSERPFLAVIPESPGLFKIMNDDLDGTGIRLVATDGKVVAENIRAENRVLDLRSVPKGVYLVEMVNSGWSVRQRIVVGL